MKLMRWAKTACPRLARGIWVWASLRRCVRAPTSAERRGAWGKRGDSVGEWYFAALPTSVAEATSGSGERACREPRVNCAEWCQVRVLCYLRHGVCVIDSRYTGQFARR